MIFVSTVFIFFSVKMSKWGFFAILLMIFNYFSSTNDLKKHPWRLK